MGIHVDLVENRWSAGYQERVGTVVVEAGQFHVETSDAHYRDVVLGAMPERAGQSASMLLQALPEHFHSDYFFAAEPHDEGDCPFADGDRIALGQASAVHPAVSA